MHLTFLRRTHLTGSVWSYQFKPSQALSWTAGQFIKVELPHDDPDAEGTKRFFTISSAPGEQVIQITTRHTDTTFKQTLSHLQPGSHINLLDLPAGDFTWRPSGEPLVFVARGIGITPFFSLLLDRAQRHLPLSATLMYSNRAGATPPFQPEITDWARLHTEFTLHQQADPFTAELVSALVPRLAESLVYVSGPISLIELLSPPYSLSPRQLKTDFFPGYTADDY
jgi:ferredoxin-NADP reductase